MTSTPRRVSIPAILVFCATLAFATGCNRGPAVEVPSLYRVKGTVQYKNGKPMAVGFVQFVGNRAEEFTINGFTGQDGTFTLNTLVARNGDKLPGAPAGEYEVRIRLPMGENQAGGGEVRLPAKYVVKAQNDNDFAITIATK